MFCRLFEEEVTGLGAAGWVWGVWGRVSRLEGGFWFGGPGDWFFFAFMRP